VVLVDDDGVWLIECRTGCLAAVAGVALLAITGDRRDDAGLEMHLADAMIGGLGDVEIAVAVELAVKRLAQCRLHREAAVASVALLASAGEGGHRAGVADECDEQGE